MKKQNLTPENVILEKIAIEQDNEEMLNSDIRSEYREQQRREDAEAAIENEVQIWDIN